MMIMITFQVDEFHTKANYEFFLGIFRLFCLENSMGCNHLNDGWLTCNGVAWRGVCVFYSWIRTSKTFHPDSNIKTQSSYISLHFPKWKFCLNCFAHIHSIYISLYCIAHTKKYEWLALRFFFLCLSVSIILIAKKIV